MEKVAFVTYNTVGENLSSGWHGSNGRRALVLQRTKGDGRRSGGNANQLSSDGRREEVGILWGELQKALPELDHVVVYVGANGSQRAIELASTVPPSKVTFVGCDCGLPEKEFMIQQAGMDEAGRVLCECGGHLTMELLFKSF